MRNNQGNTRSFSMSAANGNGNSTAQPAQPRAPQVLKDTSKSAEQQRIAQLEAQLAAAQAKLATKKTLRCKVSQKGAVSLYGLNARFPVTLYANQWEAVFQAADSIRAFIKANEGQLSQPGAED